MPSQATQDLLRLTLHRQNRWGSALFVFMILWWLSITQMILLGLSFIDISTELFIIMWFLLLLVFFIHGERQVVRRYQLSPAGVAAHLTFGLIVMITVTIVISIVGLIITGILTGIFLVLGILLDVGALWLLVVILLLWTAEVVDRTFTMKRV